MTTLYDCLQEVIGHGPDYFIRSSASEGASGRAEWDPPALLADIRRTSPGVLEDHAWTEWSALPGGSRTCIIHYGIFGVSLGYEDVPGYGALRALELSQKRPISTSVSPDASRPLDGLVLGPWPAAGRPAANVAPAERPQVPDERARSGGDGLAACRELSHEGRAAIYPLRAPIRRRPQPLG